MLKTLYLFGILSPLFSMHGESTSLEGLSQNNEKVSSSPTDAEHLVVAPKDNSPRSGLSKSEVRRTNGYECALPRTQTKNNWSTELSALYWLPQQEGMTLAIPTAATNLTITGLTFLPQNVSFIEQKTQFSPGFKLRFGYADPSQWTYDLTYTYFHYSEEESYPPLPDSRGTPVLSLPSWYGTLFPFATKLLSKWKLNFDLIDFMVGHPLYCQEKVLVAPYGGLRTFVLRQNLCLSSQQPAALINPAVSHNQSRGWALGPVLGTQNQWRVGHGFLLNANLEGGLTYMRFKVRHADNSNIPTNTPNVTAGGTSYSILTNTVCPLFGTKMGLGWEKGTCTHFTLSVNYEFLYLWGQNQMRRFIDVLVSGSDSSAGALSFQGLTASASLDY